MYQNTFQSIQCKIRYVTSTHLHFLCFYCLFRHLLRRSFLVHVNTYITRFAISFASFSRIFHCFPIPHFVEQAKKWSKEEKTFPVSLSFSTNNNNVKSRERQTMKTDALCYITSSRWVWLYKNVFCSISIMFLYNNIL